MKLEMSQKIQDNKVGKCKTLQQLEMAKIKMTQLNRSMITLNLQLRMILRLVLNLCRGDDGDKIPFISEVSFKEVKDEDNDDNMLFTMEIKIDNDSKLAAKVE